jgi:hypothetical protein
MTPPKPLAAPPATSIPLELQQMWLQLVRSSWSSIVLIPTEPSTSGRAIASAITEMAPFYQLGEFKVINAEGASLQDGAQIARELAASASKGTRVVIAVDSPMENGGAMPLIMAADAALLLVRLGVSDLTSARKVVAFVGRERVLGAVAVGAQAAARAS